MDEFFVAEFPLLANTTDKFKLDSIFRCANKMKNNLIAYQLSRLKQLERTNEWNRIQSIIKELYPLKDKTKEQEAALRSAYKEKQLLLRKYGFSKYDFQKQIKRYRKPYEKVIHSQIAQNIASNVWSAFEDLFFGTGKAVHFSPVNEFRSLCSKSNETGIVYQDGAIHLCKSNKALIIPVKFGKDKYLYVSQAFQNEIRFCKLVRRPYTSGWTYFVQICFKGSRPVKIIPETGELLHPMGTGTVGHDIGPQTLASVGDNNISLVVLAEQIESIDKRLRLINRALDRSRRATNPLMFNDKGEIIPVNMLPPECINSKGKRVWKKSKVYLKLEAKRRYLLSQKALQTYQAHRELANKLLSFGNIQYIEKMDWSALAKRAKETRINDKGKYQRKKRYGKSISNKSPATFEKILEYALNKQGGKLIHINTWKAKASQFDHTDKVYKKKHLSQRWSHLSNGDKIQRDLYSAFLIQNINDDLSTYNESAIETKYPIFKKNHDDLIYTICTTPFLTVSSFGIRK